MKPQLFLSLSLSAASLALLALPNPATAQQSASAREAVSMTAERFGPRSVQWLAEIRGTGGIPQPAEWEILSFDERQAGLLYQFRAGVRGVADLGPDSRRYPIDVPIGYFSPNDIGVDSVAAFTIAEGEARKARMAFDSCDYVLRLREFSTDPLWRLSLLDGRRQIVGKIYVSGRSGAVLRTVWVYNEGGRQRIVDSFAPNGGSMSVTEFTPPGPGITGIAGLDGPEAAEPNGDTGIYRMRPPAGPEPGASDSGIASIPAPPAPGSALPPIPNRTEAPMAPAAPRPYTPADDGIPDPPAVSGSTSESSGQMRDLRDEPTAKPDPAKPPIEVPSGGGSSERIPPPPIPPGS